MPKRSSKVLDGLEVNLRFLREIGVEDAVRPAKRAALRREVGPAAPRGPAGPAPAGGLEELNREILACVKCGLAQGRIQAVPGEGNPKAELMFVGEGPGRDEDEQGRPFVGRAGQLLTKIIEAIDLRREDVYIANVIKCRPPENRVPHRGEVEACTPHLLRQIEIIRPKVIVTLGKTSTEFFLPDVSGSMTSIRGRFYDWRGLRIMPTFHPSYLIRNEGNKAPKKMVWDDMKLVMALLGGK